MKKTKIQKPNYVGYYRVSTEEQGKSGLGLLAQKREVQNYILSQGNLVGEFKDVKSGADETRSGMISAISCCKKHNATLVVKEISRISRGGYKIRQLLEESDVDFVEASSPYDSEMLKDIKFALAKEERKKIRNRIKTALNEIKQKLANGELHVSKTGKIVTELGNPVNFSAEGRKKSLEIRTKKAYDNPDSQRAALFILDAKKEGLNNLLISDKLNKFGFVTSTGKKFHSVQVKRLYDRYKDKL